MIQCWIQCNVMFGLSLIEFQWGVLGCRLVWRSIMFISIFSRMLSDRHRRTKTLLQKPLSVSYIVQCPANILHSGSGLLWCRAFIESIKLYLISQRLSSSFVIVISSQIIRGDFPLLLRYEREWSTIYFLFINVIYVSMSPI